MFHHGPRPVQLFCGVGYYLLGGRYFRRSGAGGDDVWEADQERGTGFPREGAGRLLLPLLLLWYK